LFTHPLRIDRKNGNLDYMNTPQAKSKKSSRATKPVNKGVRLPCPIARSITLAELTKYQSGAIVSREVLRKPTGTVTAFAFDAGQALSEHTAPFDALICMLDGEAEMRIAGKKCQVGAGQMIILPANKPHAVKAVTRFKMLLVMIRS